MYLVKKCENGWNSYRAKRKWKVVLATESKHDAAAFFKQEMRYLLEADPNLDRKTIESRLDIYNLSDDPSKYWGIQNWHGRRIEMGHGNVGFAVYKSHAKEYDVPVERPAPSEMLDKILSR
jgi:hypothetical protein